MALKLLYITNSVFVAEIAQRYDVDRIFIDLETLGKEERQAGINSVKSNHAISDIKMIRPRLKSSKLLVRVNPINRTSGEEIESVISAGADIIMLPMWKSAAEVANFIKLVRGRVKTNLLLETREAAECLDAVLEIPGIDEIHIGLNDLHLSYKQNFMFEPLVNGQVESICKKIKAKGIPFGIGGVARLGEGLVRAENIIVEHYRLGSSMAILSRSFCNAAIMTDGTEIERIFRENMRAFREFEKKAAAMTCREYEQNREALALSVSRVALERMKKDDVR